MMRSWKVFIKSALNAGATFKKVARAEYYEQGHSVKMVDKEVVLITLGVNHKRR
jgi:hypothetical protein